MSTKVPSRQLTISTVEAPAPISLFSQGVSYNGMVYCSGSIGLDAKTNRMVSGGVEEHTIQILKNLAAVLETAGSCLGNVLKVNVFLISMDDFDAMNRGYTQFFKAPLPVRTCVCVKALPLKSEVEIECTGYI